MKADVITVDIPKHSYAIFCYTEAGDLFVNSDWGFYGYAWRHFGDNFAEFLMQCEPEYVVGKFELNYQPKKMKHEKEHLIALFTAFQEQLKITTP